MPTVPSTTTQTKIVRVIILFLRFLFTPTTIAGFLAHSSVLSRFFRCCVNHPVYPSCLMVDTANFAGIYASFSYAVEGWDVNGHMGE